MSFALFPGSFDPPTLGHQDVILRASKLCKKLIVGVARNINKRASAFSLEERVQLLNTLLQHEKNIEVVSIEGLIVDFVKKEKIDFLIRGVRAFSDMEHEFQMALANKKMGGVETLFFMADSQYAHISSSLIREVASCGHHLKDFIPATIEQQVSRHLSVLKGRDPS